VLPAKSIALVFFALAIAVRAGAQDEVRLDVGSGQILVKFESAPKEPVRPVVLDLIGNAARAVTTYYGQFPVKHLTIRVRFHDGRGARSGKTFPQRNGALITVSVGESSSAGDLAREWLMTHEMVHLTFPSVADRHHWIEEGVATYVEPIARARTGQLTPEKVWGDMVAGMPQGLPQAGDRGLDYTHTWGRTYWGGALFCFMADVEIRQRTGNAHGLEDALRAILKAGGTIESEWPLSKAFEIGDRATGVPVLQELYAATKDKPKIFDLDKLWKDLGVVCQPGSVTFDDSAPLAAIRRAITAPAP